MRNVKIRNSIYDSKTTKTQTQKSKYKDHERKQAPPGDTHLDKHTQVKVVDTNTRTTPDGTYNTKVKPGEPEATPGKTYHEIDKLVHHTYKIVQSKTQNTP